jgi:radical SAM protein with 4Fe4S-binding SPASM domain
LLKSHETMDDVEAFYDRWIRKTASAVIAGPSHYAGQWPDGAVVRMAPPTRFSCLRLPHRAMILADGRMTLCDQDFHGWHAVGSVRESPLAELWQGPALSAARQYHSNGVWNDLPLCRECDEWHRP